MGLQAISEFNAAFAAGKPTQKPDSQADFAALLMLEAEKEKEKNASGPAPLPTVMTVSNDPYTPPEPKKSDLSASAPVKEKTPAEQFLEYMNKTPEERWQESWLAKQGLTKEEFEALPADEQEKLMAKMREELEEMIKQETEKAMKEQGAQTYL